VARIGNRKAMGQVDDFFVKARGIFTDKESSAFERFKQV
jgi:hypothetical protein